MPRFERKLRISVLVDIVCMQIFGEYNVQLYCVQYQQQVHDNILLYYIHSQRYPFVHKDMTG